MILAPGGSIPYKIAFCFAKNLENALRGDVDSDQQLCTAMATLSEIHVKLEKVTRFHPFPIFS